MELIALIIFIYAISKAVEDSKKAFRKSKTSYMRSVDSRFPSLPKPQRAARAVQHDVGYWSAHAVRGFPAARRGFASGWKEARQLKADGKPVLWGDVTPPGAEDLPAAREGRENAGEGSPDFPVLLRARSKSGRKINPLTGGPSDVATVYDAEDLQRRLDAAADDPDIEVTTEPLPPQEPAANPHASCNAPGCGCGCHKTSSAPESATTEGEPSMERITGTMAAANASDRYGDIGRHAGGVLPAAADTTYDGVLRSMTVAKSEAEVKATEAQQASTQADSLADAMQGLEVDSGTLSAMSDHQDAHDEVMKAHQKLFETAEAVEAALKRGHAGLSEAHKDAPVQAAAREFYQD